MSPHPSPIRSQKIRKKSDPSRDHPDLANWFRGQDSIRNRHCLGRLLFQWNGARRNIAPGLNGDCAWRLGRVFRHKLRLGRGWWGYIGLHQHGNHLFRWNLLPHENVNPAIDGLLILITFQGLGLAEGMTVGKQAGVQLIGIVAVAAWSAIASYIIIMIARGLFGLRVSEEDEIDGLDITSHGERGYDL